MDQGRLQFLNHDENIKLSYFIVWVFFIDKMILVGFYKTEVQTSSTYLNSFNLQSHYLCKMLTNLESIQFLNLT